MGPHPLGHDLHYLTYSTYLCQDSEGWRKVPSTGFYKGLLRGQGVYGGLGFKVLGIGVVGCSEV